VPKISAPMRSATFLLRLTEEEKRKLHELARERNVTLSYAMREGARLYLRDLSDADSTGTVMSP